uniref:Uncharacterized protein n=1 Tax=Anguilla anguilla TaxID=7936 RepID=A0A0E9WMT1_ANGAN
MCGPVIPSSCDATYLEPLYLFRLFITHFPVPPSVNSSALTVKVNS